MAQGFYTLDEAAAALGVSADQVNELVREKRLERLNAGGTARFRAKQVDALAVELAEAEGESAKKVSVLRLAPEDALDFDLSPNAGSQVRLGDEVDSSGSRKSGASKAGGDSDLRLVLENGSFEFDLTVDSDPRLESHSPSSGRLGKPASSGRLVPGKGDSQLDFDAPTLGGASSKSLGGKPDSDARLQEVGSTPFEDDSIHTEEIDLDAELRQQESESMARKTRVAPQGANKTVIPAAESKKGKTQIPEPGSSGLLPTTSPFELSEADIDIGSSDGSSDGGTGASALGGSEFELTLAPEEDVELSLDEDIDLGGPLPKSDLNSSRSDLSGINLHSPADSGMEGDDGSDEVDFELTLDDGPGASSGSSGPKTLRGKLSDLAAEDASEFELTLEESAGSASDDKDIFETDFELPALDEEDSESQAVALDEGDTDLESSDFDLAVDLDSEPEISEHSEVVELDEDSLDSPTPKIRRRSKITTSDDDSQFGGIDDEPTDAEIEDEEDEEEVATAAGPAPEWGIFPVIMMVPCVVVMLMAGLMSYEILHGMWGYHQTQKPSGLLVRGFASFFVDKLPPE